MCVCVDGARYKPKGWTGGELIRLALRRALYRTVP